MALIFPDGSYTINNYPGPSVPGRQKPTGSTPQKPTGEGRKPVPPRQRPVGPSTKGQVPATTKGQVPATTKGQVPASTKRQESAARAAAPKRPAAPVSKAAGTRKDADRPVTPRGVNKARRDDRIVSKDAVKKELRKNRPKARIARGTKEGIRKR